MKITVTAYLNHGRWVGECPNCPNAEIVIPGSPFICTAEHPLVRRGGGDQKAQAILAAIAMNQAYEVIFPEDKALIEKLNSKRKEQNRNWKPGESVKDLVAENLDHEIKQGGLGVDHIIEQIKSARLAEQQTREMTLVARSEREKTDRAKELESP